MKIFKAVIFVIGLATLGLLLWKLDAFEVMRLIAKVGWFGFAVILLQEAVPHAFNAMGWRYAVEPKDVRLFRFKDLFLHRIQGDGVNYLTPSATIAGEFTRALLVDNSVPASVRMGSVARAKCTQSLAQIGFCLSVAAWLYPADGARLPLGVSLRAACLSVLGLMAVAGLFLHAWVRRRSAREDESVPGHWLKSVPGQVRDFYARYPLRWWISTGFFVLGYAWTLLEIWWICLCLGVRVDARTALLIEALSGIADMAFFMVPAKVGTQEAGKTAIFHILGLGARTGLALGIIRHIRELVWASFGMGLYVVELRRNPDASLRVRPEPLTSEA
ncbi:MAG: lysylphosphatidylglycerol synthase transmembrane domain-containing protein [Elusimicrobiota bacterium]|jgi:hypothetical protein